MKGELIMLEKLIKREFYLERHRKAPPFERARTVFGNAISKRLYE